MNVDEAARALGCSRGAIRKAIARGTIRARLRRGRGPAGEYSISLREVERYRAEHRWPRGREEYAAVAREVDGGVGLDSVDEQTLRVARQYATRRHRPWPPRLDA